ncbi:PAS domain-containing sensor histidine kinase [Hyalangium rubrum]|uniref:histidine kinase n=1 Tax=Hyalangium rubrum TaxID=3103134 RepID=A0ABU5H1T2_9BACT|nr:ATP-binding protein [Hyalangium sp. s54d21]MDY7226874.1 ATP-binding protein [Hyalangium sp. s54d21]
MRVTSEEPPARDSGVWAAMELQTEFHRGGDVRQLCARLLGLLLEQTRSGYGFVGELFPEAASAPRFRALASTPTCWMDALERAPDSELAALFNDASALRGLPLSPGGAPVSTFLLLPLEVRRERVGMIGLANRPGGYDAELIGALQPLLTVGAVLVQGSHAEQRRQRTEEALRQAQANTERLSLALGCVEDGFWELDLPTETLHPSRRFLELVGKLPGELEHTIAAWGRLCHPEDVAEVQRMFAEQPGGDAPRIQFTYRARRPDGTWAWILCRAQVVERDAQGRAVRVMGTDFDITVHKQTEERLSALIQAIPDLIFRIGVDGTFIDYNAGNPEPTALPPSVFLGKRIQDLPLPKPFIELTLTQVQRVIREGGTAVYEYQLGKPPLGLQHYEARAVRSGPDEAVCIVRNITERKLSEERQAQLIQGEKLALMGQLAAGVAHEINNPVSYVTSNLRSLGRYLTDLTPLLRSQRELMDSLKRGEPPPAEQLTRARELWAGQDTEFLLQDMTDIVRESLDGSRRIKEIAQGLRTFSREEEEQPQHVDLNEELESTLRMVWNELKYKCELKRDFGELPLVACYPTQLAQVFTNLLVNASQAIEKWGEIRVRTRQEGDEVVVSISDTGKGMDPETLARLATPFFTTKPRGQGTGLGLYVSYGIIARHKGRVEVRSEPGKGTTFTLHLPLVQEERPSGAMA